MLLSALVLFRILLQNINVSDKLYLIYAIQIFERHDSYHIQLRNSWRHRSHLLHKKRFRFIVLIVIIIILREPLSIQNYWHRCLCTGAPAKQ